MYIREQKKLLAYVRNMVKQFFDQNPVKAHGFDHAERVSKWAVIIAKAENESVFLAELAALLHDIGRVPEHYTGGNSKTHHELSYELCQRWFREHEEFDILLKIQKLQILYALRYHYNNAADKYPVAWILRDADKLDALGQIGLRRSLEFYNTDSEKIRSDMRVKADMVLNLHSKKARLIMKQGNLFEPIRKYCYKILKKQIKPVEL